MARDLNRALWAVFMGYSIAYMAVALWYGWDDAGQEVVASAEKGFMLVTLVWLFIGLLIDGMPDSVELRMARLKYRVMRGGMVWFGGTNVVVGMISFIAHDASLGLLLGSVAVNGGIVALFLFWSTRIKRTLDRLEWEYAQSPHVSLGNQTRRKS